MTATVRYILWSGFMAQCADLCVQLAERSPT